MAVKPAQQAAIERRRRRSDATFWTDGTACDHAYWGEWQARMWKRAGWKRALTWLLLAAAAFGMLFYRVLTERASAVVLGLAAGYGLIRLALWRENWGHDRTVVRPLAYRAAGVLDQVVEDRRAWLTVPQDYAVNDDAKIIFDVPPDFTAAEQDMEDLTRAVTVSTGWLAPKADPVLKSRHPRLIYSQNKPPPLDVGLKDIRPRIDAVKPSVVVLGLACGFEPVELDLDSETPHVGVSIKTGGGKSEFLKNIAAQVLYHGGIVMILDYKLTSHMWADMLPNVSYARTPAEIQEALMWLAWDEYDGGGNIIRPSELTRRKEVVLAARRAGQKPNPGPRLLILAEEKNATTRALKRFHRRMGGKGTSPALESMDETGETGRFIRVNAMHAAQRLSAKASGADGSRDAFENLGAVITKDPNEQTWKLVGGGHAQPPKSGHKGRYQLVTDAGVTEFQGALYDADVDESDRIARELATSGTIGEVPHDMPFVYRGPRLVPAGIGHDVFARQEGCEQAFVVGHDDPVLPAGEGPRRAVTLAEAVAAGLFVSKAAARKLPKRHGWKPVVEDDVGGHQYALSDIHAYLRTRGKR